MDYLLLLLDSPEQADEIRGILETYGCPLIVVCSLQEAVAALSAKEPRVKLALIGSTEPIKALAELRVANETTPILILSDSTSISIPTGMGRVAVLSPKTHHSSKDHFLQAIGSLLD